MRKRLSIKYIVGVFIFLLLVACKEGGTETVQKEQTEETVQFDQELVTKLEKMTEVDQLYAGVPQGKHEGDWDAWMVLRDSVNRAHQKFLKEVIDSSGYPGFDRVGKGGESDFWVMVQHSDFDPVWQEEVLELLKPQVKANNAAPAHVGLLTDRVRVNTGRPQLYGTQRHFNELQQAYIKDLEDRAHVNERRAALGMETLEEYLNEATLFHFEVNKELFKKLGVTEPVLYTVPE
ncbi:DUF6624 domain-containing protein [uncultured Dokdonia sp.]|uniref:DUF6624 domain-containing protein n=1 Tax=uncultured Dokdonia sp. TaxID=575653 RepID=UPI002624587D|nr:DUF6624 domain-containing protein [uncultured Dokdonia sp.]